MRLETRRVVDGGLPETEVARVVAAAVSNRDLGIRVLGRVIDLEARARGGDDHVGGLVCAGDRTRVGFVRHGAGNHRSVGVCVAIADQYLGSGLQRKVESGVLSGIGLRFSHWCGFLSGFDAGSFVESLGDAVGSLVPDACTGDVGRICGIGSWFHVGGVDAGKLGDGRRAWWTVHRFILMKVEAFEGSSKTRLHGRSGWIGNRGMGQRQVDARMSDEMSRFDCLHSTGGCRDLVEQASWNHAGGGGHSEIVVVCSLNLLSADFGVPVALGLSRKMSIVVGVDSLGVAVFDVLSEEAESGVFGVVVDDAKPSRYGAAHVFQREEAAFQDAGRTVVGRWQVVGVGDEAVGIDRREVNMKSGSSARECRVCVSEHHDILCVVRVAVEKEMDTVAFALAADEIEVRFVVLGDVGQRGARQVVVDDLHAEIVGFHRDAMVTFLRCMVRSGRGQLVGEKGLERLG